jgi:hypothetical protein
MGCGFLMSSKKLDPGLRRDDGLALFDRELMALISEFASLEECNRRRRRLVLELSMNEKDEEKHPDDVEIQQRTLATGTRISALDAFEKLRPNLRDPKTRAELVQVLASKAGK